MATFGAEIDDLEVVVEDLLVGLRLQGGREVGKADVRELAAAAADEMIVPRGAVVAVGRAGHGHLADEFQAPEFVEVVVDGGQRNGRTFSLELFVDFLGGHMAMRGVDQFVDAPFVIGHSDHRD